MIPLSRQNKALLISSAVVGCSTFAFLMKNRKKQLNLKLSRINKSQSGPYGTPEGERNLVRPPEDKVDEALLESFPASDPPSY